MKIAILGAGLLVAAAGALGSAWPVMAPESFPVPAMDLIGSARTTAAAKRQAIEVENEIFQVANDPWARDWERIRILMRMYHHDSEPDAVDVLSGRHPMNSATRSKWERWVASLQAPKLAYPTVLPPPEVRRMIKEFVVNPRFNGDPRMIKIENFSFDPKFTFNPPMSPTLGR